MTPSENLEAYNRQTISLTLRTWIVKEVGIVDDPMWVLRRPSVDYDSGLCPIVPLFIPGIRNRRRGLSVYRNESTELLRCDIRVPFRPMIRLQAKQTPTSSHQTVLWVESRSDL